MCCIYWELNYKPGYMYLILVGALLVLDATMCMNFIHIGANLFSAKLDSNFKFNFSFSYDQLIKSVQS